MQFYCQFCIFLELKIKIQELYVSSLSPFFCGDVMRMRMLSLVLLLKFYGDLAIGIIEKLSGM